MCKFVFNSAHGMRKMQGIKVELEKNPTRIHETYSGVSSSVAICNLPSQSVICLLYCLELRETIKLCFIFPASTREMSFQSFFYRKEPISRALIPWVQQNAGSISWHTKYFSGQQDCLRLLQWRIARKIRKLRPSNELSIKFCSQDWRFDIAECLHSEHDKHQRTRWREDSDMHNCVFNNGCLIC